MYGLVRRLLFLVPPERIHTLVFALLRSVTAIAPARWLLNRWLSPTDPVLASTVFGARFPGPLGLAAGFDKDGIGLKAWGALGFGYAEVGTVTAHPQPGNPAPRLFRLPADRALLNRLGFNNHGAAALASTLARHRPDVPIGVNIGKTKATPPQDAADDYERRHHARGDERGRPRLPPRPLDRAPARRRRPRDGRLASKVAPQVFRQRGGRLVPPARLFFEALQTNDLQVAWQGRDQAPWGHRIV